MLNYGIFFPPSHGQCKAGELWAKEIKDKTDGKVKIYIFPAGTPARAEDTFFSVDKGIADIGMSCFAYTPGRFPIMGAIDLPLGYPDGSTATKVANKFFRVMKPKELDKVKVLLIHAHGPGLLHSVKPVKTLADLKGMNIRSNGMSSKIVKALGGMPVAMPQTETCEVLRKGIVDGSFGPVETLKGWKHAEVVKNTADCPEIGYTTSMFVVMNRAKWNMLPDDVKKVFEEVSAEWADVHGSRWDELDGEGCGYTTEKGNAINALAPGEKKKWVAAVQDVINEYIKEVMVRGLPGDRAVAGLKRLIAEYDRK